MQVSNLQMELVNLENQTEDHIASLHKQLEQAQHQLDKYKQMLALTPQDDALE